jgi:hypothetical protein
VAAYIAGSAGDQDGARISCGQWSNR